MHGRILVTGVAWPDKAPARLGTQYRLRRRQHGAVLVISLLLLFVLTLVGTASMNSTVMEEKMARNHQAKTTSFQIADSAIERHWSAAQTQLALKQPAPEFAISHRLGTAFDPIKFSEPRARDRSAALTDARARVQYCGEFSATGTGLNADLSLGSSAIKAHAFDVRGGGTVLATQARSLNERRGGYLGPKVGLKRCSPGI